MSELAQSMAGKLKRARERRGLSGAELGRKVGLNASQVSKIENGRQRLPVELLPTWCEAVGISLADVFGAEHAHHFAPIPYSPYIARLYAELPATWQTHCQRAVESLHRLYRQEKKRS
ncbi:helix-turn-helix transcriptional regulator [Microbulbifer sp. SAOS-129_SWC]|uniref:helix-turn-helix domain-containing protein n=1 Tax=Microbulbifer sp. SAOS-129_SWC TaxID=3145235 RepID=UPI0032170698